MRIAISSLDQRWKDKYANMAQCERHCAFASKRQAQLVVFPEMTLTGFCMDAESLSETSSSSETNEFFASLARRCGLFILYGYIAKEGNYYNRASLVDPQGVVRAQYDKVHPFVHAGEDRVFSGGTELAISQIDNFKIGLTVCYDLRFPELYTAMSSDCDLVVNIANWPAKRAVHWDALLKARAIENQYYMLGVNRTGVDGNGIDYCRSSKCYHPSGESLPMDPLVECLDLINLDMSSLASMRLNFPTLSSRREDIYAAFRK